MTEISSTRTAARGAAQLMVAHVGLMASGYVISVVLARGLGPASYGIYGLVYSFLLGMELIGRMGVPQAVSQRIAASPGATRDLERAGATLTAAICLTLFAGFWFSAPALARLFRIPDGAHLFRLASLDIPFYGLYFLGDHVLAGHRRFGVEAAGIVLYSVVRTVAILVLFLWIGLSVEGALIVNVVGSMVALAFMLVTVGPPSFVPDLREAAGLLRRAVPIGLFGVGSQLLFSLDLWTLNAVGGAVPEDVKGFYVAAGNVARIPNVVFFVMMSVLVPTVARALAAREDAVVRATVTGTARFLVVSLLPASALIAARSAAVMELMWGDAYAAGAHLLAILVFSHGLLYTVLMTTCAILIAADRSLDAAVVTLGILPLALLADVLLIRAAGADGAAVGALLSMTGATCAAALLVHRRVARLEPLPGLATTILASLGVAAVGVAVPVRPALLVPQIVLLAVLYLALLTKLGVVGRRDLELLRGDRPAAALAPRS